MTCFREVEDQPVAGGRGKSTDDSLYLEVYAYNCSFSLFFLV